MELQFNKEAVSFLRSPVREVRNLEQTQELKLSDGMPDIGRVLAAWGQCVLRGKEWNSDSFGISGGMMVWVLYAPEDGSGVRCMEGWIPCQMQWDLPVDTPEGQIRALLIPRFVDARSVSPRKIMIRAGFAAMGEGLVPDSQTIYTPQEMPEDVQLLIRTYPVRMRMEAGEKTFSMDEELTLPASAPKPVKLVYCTLYPRIEEQRVLGNRLLFRGESVLHVLYECEDGQLICWDFTVSISQYADLKGSYGNEARGDIIPMVTDFEVTMDEHGHFRLRCGIAAQYTVDDVKAIRLAEDAYSTARELQVEHADPELNVILESAQKDLPAQHRLHQQADIVADVSFLGDFPKQRRSGDSLDVEQNGTFQALYYTPEGSLQASTARWEGKMQLDAHDDAQVQFLFGGYGEPQAQPEGDGIALSARLPVSWTTSVQQRLPNVSMLNLGETVVPDPGRPSLILCRAGEESLWQLARSSGSTMDAIRKASGLEGDPVPGQMLLIPVL